MFGRRKWQKYVIRPIVIMAIGVVIAIHRLALLLDHVLFPSFRQVKIQRPIFVVGPPRSGTTLAHRTIAEASPEFTAMKLWELVVAPALCQKKFARWMGKLDRLVGGFGGKFVHWIDRTWLGAFDEVHPSSLFLAEEDSLGLLVYGASFHQVMAFPASERVWRLAMLDRSMSDSQRRRVMKRYLGLLQRHLYFRGNELTLVSKNPCFTGWLETLTKTFPDAGFVAPLRTPQEGLPSQLSSIQDAVQFFGGDVREPALVDRFLIMYCDYFEHLTDYGQSENGDRLVVIPFPELKANPSGEVQAAIAHLGYNHAERSAEPSEEKREKRPFRSTHKYSLQDFGLEAGRVESQLGPSFRRASALYRGRTVDSMKTEQRKRGEQHVVSDV